MCSCERVVCLPPSGDANSMRATCLCRELADLHDRAATLSTAVVSHRRCRRSRRPVTASSTSDTTTRLLAFPSYQHTPLSPLFPHRSHKHPLLLHALRNRNQQSTHQRAGRTEHPLSYKHQHQGHEGSAASTPCPLTCLFPHTHVLPSPPTTESW